MRIDYRLYNVNVINGAKSSLGAHDHLNPPLAAPKMRVVLPTCTPDWDAILQNKQVHMSHKQREKQISCEITWAKNRLVDENIIATCSDNSLAL